MVHAPRGIVTMRPLRTLAPGGVLTHVETWTLEEPIDWTKWRAPLRRV